MNSDSHFEQSPRSSVRHRFERLKRDKKLDEHNGTSILFLGLICSALFGLDYVTGPTIQEPYIYVLLVILSAWFLGPKVSYSLAILLPLFRIVALLFWVSPMSVLDTFVNMAIQSTTLTIVVFLVTSIRELMKEMRALKGSLSICVHCKKIRNQQGKWEPVETYISRQSEMKFTDGICIECRAKKLDGFVREENIPLANT